MANKKQSIGQLFFQLHWAIKFGLPFLLFIGAMGSAAATWDQFGWWKPASVWYVNDKTNPLHLRQLDMQIENAEGKRDASKQNIYIWRDKMDDEKDVARKREHRSRLDEAEDTKVKLDDQIKTLKKIRGY